MRAAPLAILRASIALVAACAACVALAAPPAGYASLRIVAPQQDETVHDNLGNVAVGVAVSPALRKADGHRIVLLLDGKVVARRSGGRIRLKGVERGTHALQAQVTAADGAVLIASQPVTFYMWRASRLFPGRKP